MTDRRHQHPQPHLRALHQFENRGALHHYLRRQPRLAEGHVEIAAKIARRLGETERQGGEIGERERFVAHQIGKLLRIEYRFNAALRQKRRLKMQLAQRRQLEKADADVDGMTVKRLQQLIGAKRGDAVVKLRIATLHPFQQRRQRHAALRHHADAQRAVDAVLQRLYLQL